MKTRITTASFLLPVILSALLLVGCTSSPSGPSGAPSGTPSSSASDSDGGQTGGLNDTGGSKTSPDSGTSHPVDDATKQYVDCLNEHGLNAMVGPDGTVQYAVTADDLGPDGVPKASTDGPDQAATEQLCQQAVPGYTPPDYNER